MQTISNNFFKYAASPFLKISSVKKCSIIRIIKPPKNFNEYYRRGVMIQMKNKSELPFLNVILSNIAKISSELFASLTIGFVNIEPSSTSAMFNKKALKK